MIAGTEDHNSLFGEICIHRGYVSLNQLEESLQDQVRNRKKGVKILLGQILVKKGFLTTDQFVEVLKIQEEFLIKCETCGTVLDIRYHNHSRTLLCEKCGRSFDSPTTVIRALEEVDMEKLKELDIEPAKKKQLGRYRIIRDLGEGGMAKVFMAHDTTLNRIVALKVIKPTKDKNVLNKFLQEARIITRLNHPNIASVHDLIHENGQYYFVMEYVEGNNLDELLFQKRLDLKQSAGILAQIARIIHHAHKKGVVHRDLKPSNIMITEGGKAYVMDFGIARELEDNYDTTRFGVLVGTPCYMSPEQFQGKEVSAKSDVYSLGVILYKILTGRDAFKGKDDDELYKKIINEYPVSPKKINKDVDSDIEVICVKAMLKNPLDRYDSAQELAEDIENYLQGKMIRSRHYPLRARVMRKVSDMKSNPWVKYFALILLIAASVFIGAYGVRIFQSNEHKESIDHENYFLSLYEIVNYKTNVTGDQIGAKKNSEAAVKEFESILKESKANNKSIQPHIRYCAGVIYCNLKLYDNALEQFNISASTENPDTTPSKQAIEQINKIREKK